MKRKAGESMSLGHITADRDTVAIEKPLAFLASTADLQLSCFDQLFESPRARLP
jgi:hypothetical protein